MPQMQDMIYFRKIYDKAAANSFGLKTIDSNGTVTEKTVKESTKTQTHTSIPTLCFLRNLKRSKTSLKEERESSRESA